MSQAKVINVKNVLAGAKNFVQNAQEMEAPGNWGVLFGDGYVLVYK